MPLEINPVFAVPLGQETLPDAQSINAELKALLLARESEGGRYANPNPSLKQQQGVFESDFNLFSWPEPCVQRLRQFCWSALGKLIQDLNGYSAEDMQRPADLLAHLVPRDPEWRIHHHAYPPDGILVRASTVWPPGRRPRTGLNQGYCGS
jgi:hypothetical protein